MQESRLALYQQISKFKENMKTIDVERQSIEAEQERLSNTDLEALRKLQKCELNLTRVKEELQTLKAAKLELSSQLNGRDQKRL
jgi:chromosome segregation ATPase